VSANHAGEHNGNWRGGRIISCGYVLIHQPGHHRADRQGYVREHTLVVERALGHPLPDKAEVHHVNEVKADNRNRNLVACQDHAYHFLLHRRMRALRACGNANYRQCYVCKRWDDPKAMRACGFRQNTIYHPSCRGRVRRELWRQQAADQNRRRRERAANQRTARLVSR
jgi:hypothetical protein